MAVVNLLIAVLSFVMALVLCLSMYLIYIHNRYSHLPSPPRSSFFLGHFPSLKAYFDEGKSFYDYLLDLYLRCGPMYVLFMIYRPVVVVTDPFYIKKIYIDSHLSVPKNKWIYDKIGFMYGERSLGYGLITNRNPSSWARRRRILGPAFHRQNLKNLMTPFNEVTDKLFRRLENCAREDKEVGMLQELGNTTLDVIAKVAFSVDLKSIGDGNSPFRKATGHVLQGVEDNLRTAFPSWFLKVYQCSIFQSKVVQEQIKAVKDMREFARKCISERLKGGDESEAVDILSYIVKCAEKDDSVTMDDLVDEFLTMLFAGYETTASSLAFTLFEVISNSEIEKKILKEVREVIGTKERVDYNDLPQLKYVGQCIMEGLRKYMIAGGPNRILIQDIVVGGYKLPAGCSVVANKYGINRSPSFWESPEVFDPDRFVSPENIPNFRYVFFPFSVGPRNCIGQTFAMFEEKVLLSRLIQKFKFRLAPGQTSKIVEKFTLIPKDGVRCKVEFR